MDSEPRRTIRDRLRNLLGNSRSETPEELEAEIQVLVDQGEARGFISADEGDMIEAILDLDDTKAGQIMVPRTDMAVVAAGTPVEETITVIVESGHSRIPVYDGDLDHIVGVLHAKDLLPFWGQGSGELDIARVAREPFFVPQSKPVNELLTEFKHRRTHLAVVVDEYGGTMGIVTIEDVLEEIVGDIADEYDNEPPLLTEQPDGSVVVNARLPIEDLADHMGVELPTTLPEGDFETVGGYIITSLGRLPLSKEVVPCGPLQLAILEADERRVITVRAAHVPEPRDQKE